MVKKLTNEQFLEKAKIVAPQFIYDKTFYLGAYSKVKIKCVIHGYFEIVAHDLLKGRGCAKCSKKYRKSNEEFIILAKQIFPQYIYDKTLFTKNKDKIEVGCPQHGYFEIISGDLLGGHGCAKCKNVYSPSTEEFIKQVKIVFPNYVYNNVIYINNRTKIKILCRLHGEFEATPYTLLKGNGCPKCSTSFNEEICRYIIENLTREKWVQSRESWNKNPKTGRLLQLDGYCANLQAAFEYDGQQHFSVMRYDKSPLRLEKRQELDMIKDSNCITHNVKLLRIPYTIPYHEIIDFIKNKLVENNIFIFNVDLNIDNIKEIIRNKLGI